MDLSYREVVHLAIDAAINLDNFSRGKIFVEENPCSLQKLKQWFLSQSDTFSSHESVYRGAFSPTTAFAIEDLLVSYWHLFPKCLYVTELGKKIKEHIGIFDYGDEDEARRLRDFCVAISRKFLSLSLDWHYPCRLAV